MINARIILIVLLVMTGCRRLPLIRSKPVEEGRCYLLKVDGVECALCAKKTILALEKIAGVLRVEYICNDSQYYDCFAKIYLANEQTIISQQVFKDQLLVEGFDLISMTRI